MKWVKIHSPKTLKSLVEIVCFFGKAHRYLSYYSNVCFFLEKFLFSCFVCRGRSERSEVEFWTFTYVDIRQNLLW